MIHLRPLIWAIAVSSGAAAAAYDATATTNPGFGRQASFLPNPSYQLDPNRRLSSHCYLNYGLGLRGGDVSNDATRAVAEGILSSKNLATFFACKCQDKVFYVKMLTPKFRSIYHSSKFTRSMRRTHSQWTSSWSWLVIRS